MAAFWNFFVLHQHHIEFFLVIDGGIDQGIGNFIDQVRNPTPAGMS